MSKVTELFIENFQGISNRQVVQFGNFSLIFGENSAGKSSLARALLLLGQSFSNGLLIKGDNAPRFFVFSGNLIDLVGFRNVVHKHDDTRVVSMGLRLEMEDAQSFFRLSPIRRKTAKSDRVSVESIRFSVSESATGLQSLQLGWDFRASEGIDFLTIDFQADESGNLLISSWDESSWSATKRLLEIEGDVDYQIDLIKVLRFRLAAGVPAVKDNLASTPSASQEILASALTFLLQKTRFNLGFHLSTPSHIPSLRPIVERVSVRNTQLSASKRIRQNLDKREGAANSYLQQLTNNRYEVQRRTYEGGEFSFLGEVEVNLLRDNFLNVSVSFQDVGVGLSQVLPLLIALDSFSLQKSDGFAIVEQPELHLHPKMQAQLAELMLETTESNGQIIAETHSEPMLLRIQRIMRDRTLEGRSIPSVAIIYASFDPELGTRFENLHLRSDLDFIVHMPTSFSDLRFEELS